MRGLGSGAASFFGGIFYLKNVRKKLQLMSTWAVGQLSDRLFNNIN